MAIQRILLNEPAYGSIVGETYGETVGDTVSVTDSVSNSVVGETGDSFSLEDSLPGDPWTTILDLAWPNQQIPHRKNYEADTHPAHIINYGTDWPYNKYWITGPGVVVGDHLHLQAGVSTLYVAAPNDTTFDGAFVQGERYVYFTELDSTSERYWDQSHSFTLAGHSSPYWIQEANHTTRLVLLSRPLEFAVTNGQAITYRTPYEIGDTVVISHVHDGSWPYYETRTVASHPDRWTVGLNSPLSYAHDLSLSATSCAKCVLDWNSDVTVEEDLTYPGSNKYVNRHRLRERFPGGYIPGKIAKHPNYSPAVGTLQWPAELCTGNIYIAGYTKLSADFTHNRNKGTKWHYLKSSTVAGIAHITLSWEGTDDWTDGFWPAFTTQYADNSQNEAYIPTKIPANEIPLGEWVPVEVLCLVNTPGSYNGTLIYRINGVEVYNNTAVKFFLSYQTSPSYDQLELSTIYGGGVNESPIDQSMWTGRLLIKVR
jgi:hypothetical protein